ncbi:Protein neprosin [Cardamine amara subsp. amara]|uniref:Protein neprosin n=1 Tax=Cardamine amara subsp. amara TaxID=228776 RepID=A0ABD1BUD9_CARAN
MHPQNSTLLSLFLFYLVATIHANDDQAFECVDIYKQPSLQHPLLKNHKLQITSSSKRTSSICPRGMVPIHKLRNKVNSNFARDAVNWATLDTKTESKKYHGASAVVSIHNPTFSGKDTRAQIMIENGESPQGINCIVFGWAIDPELYGDNMTHFTTYWTSDGFQKTGCYNTKCKGYIQQFSELYAGKPFDPVSTYGGQQVVANLSIIRDGDTGNWMLTNYGALVGYWPKEIFTSLGSGADTIRYGGVAVNGAPMGNGQFPDNGNDLNKSSYFKDMAYIDANFQKQPINELEMNVNVPKPNCYKLNYLKDQLTITYGGPGGSC